MVWFVACVSETIVTSFTSSSVARRYSVQIELRIEALGKEFKTHAKVPLEALECGAAVRQHATKWRKTETVV